MERKKGLYIKTFRSVRSVCGKGLDSPPFPHSETATQPFSSKQKNSGPVGPHDVLKNGQKGTEMKDENRISPQQRLVMRHLENRGSITALEAFNDYGIASLSAIIHRLRERDIPITTTLETGVNRFGDSVTYARYRLELPRRICPVSGQVCSVRVKKQGKQEAGR